MIVDYPEILEIEITNDDIVNGKPRSAKECSIALALKRNFPPETPIKVGAWNIYLDKDCTVMYSLGQQGTDFIELFDNNEVVVPTKFYFRRFN